MTTANGYILCMNNIIAPSYLLTPISIDISNYQKESVDSDYVKVKDLSK
jgi:ABC-type xylose transport system substrate-binding protein